MSKVLLLANGQIVGGNTEPANPEDFAGMGKVVTGHAFLEDVDLLVQYMSQRVKLTDSNPSEEFEF